MNPVFGNESARLEISGRDGHIVALQYGGENLLLESSAAFALRLLEVATGEYRFFSSADFTHYSFIGNFSRWTGCAGYADLTVECKISFDGRFFRFRPAVSNIPPEFWVDLIEMPQVVVRYENELFWSHCGGCLAREPWLSERKFKQIGFPGDSDLNIYPGSCQMQFFASWGKKYGLYFAADDYSHSTKDLELSPDGGGRIRLRMECTWGEAGMGGTAVLPFDLVLGGFSGDWQDACEIYRDWVKKDPGMERKITLPKWLDESPVVVVYPVCGNGTIAPEPNRFQPYDRAFPRIKELSEALDSPIMVHLMRWDHNGPWLPPYHWPPVGDIEAFFRFRDLLHESGNYLGLYGSGTSYTRKSKINDYSDEDCYQCENLERHMARGPKGEVDAGICKDLRDGHDMCISEAWCRDVLREQVRLAAENGIDFFQLFDQNHGSESFTCYSRDHHHPPLPGVWQTEVMVKFIDELNEEIREVGSKMILGAESAAAGPYIAGLPFNDIRESLVYGSTVPSTAYVFHRYCNNFFGNQAGAWENIDCLACPDNLQYRLACGFVRGELLSFTLRDSGEIDWGAAADWDRPAPKQEPLLRLVKIFNRLRRSYAQYLADGEMRKSFASIQCEEYVLTVTRKHLRVEELFPALPHATWLAPDGTGAQFIVNFREQPERSLVNPAGPCTLLQGENTRKCEVEFTLKMPPLSVAILLFNQ